MADRTLFPVKLISPEGVLFDAPAQMFIVTGTDGNVGVLARHAPLVAHLKDGFVAIQSEGGEWKHFATAEGFAKTDSVEGTILVQDARPIDGSESTIVVSH